MDSIGVPLKLTLPSLESNVEPVFTACYCHVSQCLILSNWVMTTTLQSDTSTARSVHSIASFTQRNWVKPTCTTEHIAGDTSESNKSNRRYQTHTYKDTCVQECTRSQIPSKCQYKPDSARGFSRLHGWRCIITARWIWVDSDFFMCVWFLHQLLFLPSLSWYTEFIFGHNHEVERLPSFVDPIDLTIQGARLIKSAYFYDKAYANPQKCSRKLFCKI